MRIKEKAKEIRKELKEIGLTSRDVSVRVRHHTSINIDIKTVVSPERIEKIARKYEKIDRCEASGEILMGGNDFVFVDFDYEYLKEQEKRWIEKARELLKEKEEKGAEILTAGYVGRLWVVIRDLKKYDVVLEVSSPSSPRLFAHVAQNETALARALFHVEARYGALEVSSPRR